MFLFLRWLFDCFLLVIPLICTIFLPPKRVEFYYHNHKKKIDTAPSFHRGRWETTTASGRFRTRRLAWVGKAQLVELGWLQHGSLVGTKPSLIQLLIPYRSVKNSWRFCNIMVMFGVAWLSDFFWKNPLGHEHGVHEVVEWLCHTVIPLYFLETTCVYTASKISL